MALVKCPDCGRDVSTAATTCPQCGRPMAAVAAPAPLAAPGKEETLWHGTPSWLLAFGKIIQAVVVAIVLPLIYYFGSDFLAQYHGIVTAVIAIVIIVMIVNVIVALARIKTTIYTITTQRVIIETGLASKKVEDIDLRYVEDTQFQQGFIQRVLGIGNVTIVSSDKLTPTYMLRGVPDPRGLRELIRANAYQVSQRQLFTRAT
ncbi:MAG TPA: PH domain-containing protein [Thermoanaerobaculia bacterium]|nr:PH domain-containing protein [Thermoanaerobaculia bacterium]